MHDIELYPTRHVRAGALLAGAALLLAAAGCSNSKPTAPRTSLVPLTLATQASGTGSFRAVSAASALTLAGAQNDTVNVTFSKAYLVVRDVKFILPDLGDDHDSTDSEDSLNTSDGWGDHDSIPELEDDEAGAVTFRGPFVLDLLNHTAASLDTMMVPPGDYHHVQGHLQALHSGDAAATPDLSFLIGSTVWLEGTIGGDGGGPFTFHARIDDEFQIRGHFTVQANTPATAFITFNPDLWLLNREGHFLDPRIDTNLRAIESAIRHSIKVGMDSNHDGKMDDDDMHASMN